MINLNFGNRRSRPGRPRVIVTGPGSWIPIIIVMVFFIVIIILVIIVQVTKNNQEDNTENFRPHQQIIYKGNRRNRE